MPLTFPEIAGCGGLSDERHTKPSAGDGYLTSPFGPQGSMCRSFFPFSA